MGPQLLLRQPQHPLHRHPLHLHQLQRQHRQDDPENPGLHRQRQLQFSNF